MVEAARPFAVIVRPGLRTVPTSVPEVGLFGGVFPLSLRTITPANELAVGFTHLSETDEDVSFVTFKELTGASPRADAPAAAGDNTDATTATAAATLTQARTRTSPPKD
jgi:hypothetical protein